MGWFDYNDPDKINSYLFQHKKKDSKQPTPTVLCKCPVCKNTLGRKAKDNIESFHCKDCRATYTFYAGVKLPSGYPDRFLPKECNCPACKARRGEKEPEEPKITFEPDWDESDLP